LENPTDTIDVEPETVVQCSDNDTDPVSPWNYNKRNVR
jgi:hypothetical protein